ncbi:MAG TPA: thiolase family protein [Thermodesulfobacteriota bacterium]|nr:thiolase family protein [Thermodesulfobacteriota bacterium]
MSDPGPRPVVIVDGVRTPFAKAGTALKDVPARELGRIVVRELLERTELDPADVDEVIFGNIGQPIDATNIARVIALSAGIPKERPAHTVQRNCASGLEAVAEAYQKIRYGEADVIVAGGTESMSQLPLLFSRGLAEVYAGLVTGKTLRQKAQAALRFRPRDLVPVVSLVEGLRDPICGLSMGETAELLAREFGISREAQDAFALRSHQRAVAAQREGRLAEEIVPVFTPPDYGRAVVHDVGPRPNQTLDALAKLPPVFDREHGTVTAGNACPVTDGAAALLVMSEERARALGYRPLGRIRSVGFAGVEPERMGLGPALATPVALDRAGLTLADLALVEINEAFAAQVLACLAAMASRAFYRERTGRDRAVGEVDPERLNVNGGAIALGHPVGTSGARLVLTLLKELARRGGGFGLATLCVGGGQGGAIVVEGLG